MALNSINTNASALMALTNLSNTQMALSQTQNIISTGKKINSAKDNGAVCRSPRPCRASRRPWTR